MVFFYASKSLGIHPKYLSKISLILEGCVRKTTSQLLSKGTNSKELSFMNNKENIPWLYDVEHSKKKKILPFILNNLT